MKSTRGVLGLSLGCSLVHLHCSLLQWLCTARFAHSLRSFARFTHELGYAHSLARSRAHGKEIPVFALNASIPYSFNPLCSGLFTWKETVDFRTSEGFHERSGKNWNEANR